MNEKERESSMTNQRWRMLPNGRALLVLLSLALMSALVFAACGGDDEEQQQAAPAAAAAEPQEQQAEAEVEVVWIDIGVVAPSSGSYEVFGHTYEASGKFVEFEINTGAQYCIDQGVCEEGGGFLIDGKLHKLRIHFRDDRSDINAHVALVQELVRDVGIVACMCGTPHDFAIASSKVTQPAKVLHFSGSSTLEEILTAEATAPGGENRYLFQTETREWQRSGSVMKGAVDLIAPDSEVSVIMMLNDATGQFLGPYFKRAAGGQRSDGSGHHLLGPRNDRLLAAVLTRQGAEPGHHSVPLRPGPRHPGDPAGRSRSTPPRAGTSCSGSTRASSRSATSSLTCQSGWPACRSVGARPTAKRQRTTGSATRRSATSCACSRRSAC